jgi:putative copper export protein
LLRERSTSAADWLAWRAEGAAVGAGAMAWAGHAAAVDPAARPGAALADAVQVIAAGVWAGALLPLAWLAAAASRENGADARPYAVLAVRRFSRPA